MRTRLGFALVLGACLVGCRDESPRKEAASASGATVKIVGSSTMAPLVAELAKGLQATRTDLTIVIESGQSDRGISEARAGTADIGMASRALTDQENDLVGFSIARDGICFVVHKDNPVQALTSAQVVAVFTGRTRNWKALGGPDAPITLVHRPQGVSAPGMFKQYFGIESADLRAAPVAPDNRRAIEAVSSDRHAIVYLSVGEAQRQAEAGVPIALVTMDGVAATSETIRKGRYRLSRALTLVTRSLPNGPAKSFIDYATSPKAVPIIRKYDFVPYAD